MPQVLRQDSSPGLWYVNYSKSKPEKPWALMQMTDEGECMEIIYAARVEFQALAWTCLDERAGLTKKTKYFIATRACVSIDDEHQVVFLPGE